MQAVRGVTRVGVGSLKGSYDVEVGKCRRHGDLRSGCVESGRASTGPNYRSNPGKIKCVAEFRRSLKLQFSSIPALIAPDGVAGEIGHTARTEHVAPARATRFVSEV